MQKATLQRAKLQWLVSVFHVSCWNMTTDTEQETQSQRRSSDIKQKMETRVLTSLQLNPIREVNHVCKYWLQVLLIEFSSLCPSMFCVLLILIGCKLAVCLFILLHVTELYNQFQTSSSYLISWLFSDRYWRTWDISATLIRESSSLKRTSKGWASCFFYHRS